MMHQIYLLDLFLFKELVLNVEVLFIWCLHINIFLRFYVITSGRNNSLHFNNPFFATNEFQMTVSV